jgi:hypothetical protein
MASRYGRTVCSPDYETYEINAFLNYIFESRVLNATFISNYHRNIFFWHSDETTSDVKLFFGQVFFYFVSFFPDFTRTSALARIGTTELGEKQEWEEGRIYSEWGM